VLVRVSLLADRTIQELLHQPEPSTKREQKKKSTISQTKKKKKQETTAYQ
jgi:hypothetical protein